MPGDPIANYQTALQQLRAAKRRVDQLVELIQTAAQAPKTPSDVMVSNMDVGFSGDVAFSTSAQVIDGREWPDGKRLAETLANWQSAIQTARSAYSSIPEATRQEMTKWQYCEVHIQLTKDSERALVSTTLGEARQLNGSDARFPNLFRMLGSEGSEAIGFVSSRFQRLEDTEGTFADTPGTDTLYLLKRPIQS